MNKRIFAVALLAWSLASAGNLPRTRQAEQQYQAANFGD
jgi:hypothetical protein